MTTCDRLGSERKTHTIHDHRLRGQGQLAADGHQTECHRGEKQMGISPGANDKIRHTKS